MGGGKIDNGAWCRYGNGGLIARAFFSILPLLATNIVASIVLGGLARNHVLRFFVPIYVEQQKARTFPISISLGLT